MQTGSNVDHNYVVFFRNPDWLLYQPKQLYLLTAMGRYKTFWQYVSDLSEEETELLDPKEYSEIFDLLWSKLSEKERHQIESEISQELEMPKLIPIRIRT